MFEQAVQKISEIKQEIREKKCELPLTLALFCWSTWWHNSLSLSLPLLFSLYVYINMVQLNQPPRQGIWKRSPQGTYYCLVMWQSCDHPYIDNWGFVVCVCVCMAKACGNNAQGDANDSPPAVCRGPARVEGKARREVRKEAKKYLYHMWPSWPPTHITTSPPALCGAIPADDKYKCKPADQVAARVRTEDGDEEQWILAEVCLACKHFGSHAFHVTDFLWQVVSYNSHYHRYMVDDIDEEGHNEKR